MANVDESRRYQVYMSGILVIAKRLRRLQSVTDLLAILTIKGDLARVIPTQTTKSREIWVCSRWSNANHTRMIYKKSLWNTKEKYQRTSFLFHCVILICLNVQSRKAKPRDINNAANFIGRNGSGGRDSDRVEKIKACFREDEQESGQ